MRGLAPDTRARPDRAHCDNRHIPRRAKRLAWAMMVVGSAWSGWMLPWPWTPLPALFCAVVATWMYRLPDSDRG
jgi:uncharacterized membrane protein YbaN (DUF454 family)